MFPPKENDQELYPNVRAEILANAFHISIWYQESFAHYTAIGSTCLMECEHDQVDTFAQG